MIDGAALDRWRTERPIPAAYDNYRQFAAAVMAWTKRDPRKIERVTIEELAEVLRDVLDHLVEVGGHPAVQASTGADLDCAFRIGVDLLRRFDADRKSA